MSKLSIEYRAIEKLRPRENNPRAHTKKQIEKIAKSIQRFGFINPILADDDGYIIAGHGRLEAAKLVGLTIVPIIHLKEMSLADKPAYVIADNQLAAQAGWSKNILALEFAYLSEIEGFDLTLTGFELPEIDAHLFALQPQESEPNRGDSIPAAAEHAVTAPGQKWNIGRHSLICADATSPQTYSSLLGNVKAAMIFSDAPYNVKIKGHVSGLGKVEHREFAMASGEMTSFEYTSFLGRVFTNLVSSSIDGSIHYQCTDWRHQREMLDAGDANYSELKNVCV